MVLLNFTKQRIDKPDPLNRVAWYTKYPVHLTPVGPDNENFIIITSSLGVEFQGSGKFVADICRCFVVDIKKNLPIWHNFLVKVPGNFGQ